MWRSLVACVFWVLEVTGSIPAIPIFIKLAPLVQLVERRFPKPDAIGSIPIGRAIKISKKGRLEFDFY